MIPELGHFALALAVAIAAAQAVLPIVGARARDARLMGAAPALAVGQMIALIAAYGCLIWSAVVNDFSVYDVAMNSSSHEPLFYRITGTWGNHDGSILLWCLVLAVCGGAVALFGRNLPSALRARVIGVLGIVSAGFLLFTLTASNPFQRMWPPPIQGAAINPLLQDPGLAIHPPILYTGYVGFSIPFAFAVAALLEGRVDATWGRWVRPWTLAAWCFLTCGIALGSWWAYYELGWGGFWFWDPVENASLLPWLTGTALLHCAIVVEKRETLKTWTVLLAIATFSLSLCGTFMVRSGILNSVHSFAEAPTQGVFILVLLAITIGGSLALFAFRAPAMAATGVFAPISREGALVLNNVLLCAICAVVFTGTTYPLFAALLHMELSVGAPYFHLTVVPLLVPLFAAMSVGPVLSWKRADLLPALLRLWWAAAIAALIGIAAEFGLHRSFAAAGFAGAAWLILGAFAEVIERIRLFRIPLANSWARLQAQPLGVWGAAVAHAGMGVTVAGIAGMSLAMSTIVAMTPGQTIGFGGYRWHVLDIRKVPGPDYTARVVDLQIMRDGRQVAVVHPSLRTFTQQKQTVTDTSIQTNLLRDLYIAPGGEQGGKMVLRLHVNPLAAFVWLGALVMALGGALSLIDRRLRVGAPARRGVVGVPA
ncbi:MAG: heme lyase CcmF/NrfE family subunit [Rhodospirillales bacterium]|jgi:cytochrome c-type biogenesis protein CcmF|nr:heme lyase CcmF/NrfE family subunit [Rhodospirillales bacterium]